MQSENPDISKSFAVLGHPTKARIFRYLLRMTKIKGEPVGPTMVAIKMSLATATVAYSMKRMAEAGILTRRVTGRYTFYDIDPSFISQIEEYFEL